MVDEQEIKVPRHLEQPQQMQITPEYVTVSDEYRVQALEEASDLEKSASHPGHSGSFFKELRGLFRSGNAGRASAVTDTQREAIERAKELNPGDRSDVERVRKTDKSGPDKWRKA